MNHLIQNPEIVAKAYMRIKDYIHRTPILKSSTLNKMLGNKIYFKMDALQKTGAFKIRGVLNNILLFQEQNKMPDKIVSYSTGNHGLAMSYVGQLFNIQVRVYLPKNVSLIKKHIARYYGAEVIEVETRGKAEELAKFDEEKGYCYLPPSDDDSIIAGAGTMCYEALEDLNKLDIKPDAIFAPCGGGGLLSGTYLAKELLSKNSQLHGVEPQIADDAYRSVKSNEIFRFNSSPETIADGLRALSISNRSLNYLRKLDDFHLVDEESIKYWTAWLIQMTKITCEPSSAISMGAVHNWLNKNSYKNKRILVLITGGNIDPELYNILSNSSDYLQDPN